MGDISAAKRHPPHPFLPDQDTLWQVEQIFAYGSRVDWLSCIGVRIARDPLHLGGLHGGSMAIPWGSLEEPMGHTVGYFVCLGHQPVRTDTSCRGSSVPVNNPFVARLWRDSGILGRDFLKSSRLWLFIKTAYIVNIL